VSDPQRIGRSIRAIRIRLGWRQEDLALRCGSSRAFVSKLERGLSQTADLGRIDRICRTLGAELDVRVRWRGEAMDRLLDEAHAALVERTVALLRAAAWEVALEVTFNVFGERGSIDVFARHDAPAAILVIEVKSVVADAQGTLGPLDRKVRLAPELARERGWPVALVSRLLVVEEGATTRRRIARFAALFDAALPARNVAVRRWIEAPVGTLRGVLFLSTATEGVTRRAVAGRQRVRRPKTP
jgi:transcriptional regulator with XRE-family HTH domain